jgi:hypothetical protein
VPKIKEVSLGSISLPLLILLGEKNGLLPVSAKTDKNMFEFQNVIHE